MIVKCRLPIHGLFDTLSVHAFVCLWLVGVGLGMMGMHGGHGQLHWSGGW